MKMGQKESIHFLFADDMITYIKSNPIANKKPIRANKNEHWYYRVQPTWKKLLCCNTSTMNNLKESSISFIIAQGNCLGINLAPY